MFCDVFLLYSTYILFEFSMLFIWVTKKNIEAFAARPQGYAAYSTPESANAALNTQT